MWETKCKMWTGEKYEQNQLVTERLWAFLFADSSRFSHLGNLGQGTRKITPRFYTAGLCPMLDPDPALWELVWWAKTVVCLSLSRPGQEGATLCVPVLCAMRFPPSAACRPNDSTALQGLWFNCRLTKALKVKGFFQGKKTWLYLTILLSFLLSMHRSLFDSPIFVST